MQRPISPEWGVWPRGVPCVLTTGEIMIIKAQRKRARMHVLRDNVHRAKRAVKAGMPGAQERLKAHQAARLAFAETGK